MLCPKILVYAMKKCTSNLLELDSIDKMGSISQGFNGNLYAVISRYSKH